MGLTKKTEDEIGYLIPKLPCQENHLYQDINFEAPHGDGHIEQNSEFCCVYSHVVFMVIYRSSVSLYISYFFKWWTVCIQSSTLAQRCHAVELWDGVGEICGMP